MNGIDFPEKVAAMRVNGRYLIVDTEIKRYRVYMREGRKPRRRLVGFLSSIVPPKTEAALRKINEGCTRVDCDVCDLFDGCPKWSSCPKWRQP